MKTLALVIACLTTSAAFAQDFDDAALDSSESVEAVDFSAQAIDSAVFAVPPTRDHRTPRADLIVKSIKIYPTITDDVSNTPAQEVVIEVQNIGNREVRAYSDEIQMNGPHYSTSVYGPHESYFLLGAPIWPGQVGHMMFQLPPNTLRHCQRVSGVIDTKHTMQSGPYDVFYNDGLGGVFVIDPKSMRACIGPVQP